MKLNEILELVDDNTKVRVAIKMFGSYFKMEHYAEFLNSSHETGELLSKKVIKMRAYGDVLEVILEY